MFELLQAWGMVQLYRILLNLKNSIGKVLQDFDAKMKDYVNNICREAVFVVCPHVKLFFNSLGCGTSTGLLLLLLGNYYYSCATDPVYQRSLFSSKTS